MSFLGWFDGEIRPDGWFDAEIQPAGWFDTEVINTSAGGGGSQALAITLDGVTVAVAQALSHSAGTSGNARRGNGSG